MVKCEIYKQHMHVVFEFIHIFNNVVQITRIDNAIDDFAGIVVHDFRIFVCILCL